jgi:hypothetical protein
VGSLRPGAAYIYERVNDTVYAREFGSTERTIVGYDVDPNGFETYKRIAEDYLEETLWQDIRTAAETNPVLQEALERVKILYHLSKDNGNKEKI